MPSATLVKQLRDATGIGMMECKKALLECDGDFKKARDWLRVKSSSKAEKLSGRTVAEGRISYAAWENTGALLEIVCETDFVARDDNLIAFSDACTLALAKSPSSADNSDIEQLILADGKSCKESLQELVMKMGENINIRRMRVIQARGQICHYIHTGGKIGTMADVEGGDEELGRDICMHIAAMRPLYVAEKNIPAEEREKEELIFAAQVSDSGKAPEIAPKIIAGKMKKYLQETTLLGQSFVKEEDTTVGKLLEKRQAQVHNFALIIAGA